MQYGVFMGPTDESMDFAEFAGAAEDLGFESVWVPEHSHIPSSRATPWTGGPELPRGHKAGLDPFIALAHAAANTSTVRLGTGVCVVPERHHITLAKEVASVDFISQGRLIFGVGAGWNREEIANHGVEPSKRYEIMDERLAAMKVIWSEDEPQYHGTHVDFDPIWQWPKPLQKPYPPILVGGSGPKSIGLALSHGTGWMPFIGHGDVSGKDHVSTIELAAEHLGVVAVPVTLFGAPVDASDVAPNIVAGVERIIFRMPPASSDIVLPMVIEAASIVRSLS
jgi:probable F420-dependent oxidoreductase